MGSNVLFGINIQFIYDQNVQMTTAAQKIDSPSNQTWFFICQDTVKSTAQFSSIDDHPIFGKFKKLTHNVDGMSWIPVANYSLIVISNGAINHGKVKALLFCGIVEDTASFRSVNSCLFCHKETSTFP